MIRKNPKGDIPIIHRTSYIDVDATVIGKVIIGKNVFVGPLAVIRADEPGSSIIIKDNCNVQDRVIIHTLESTTVKISESTSLAHGCIVHGPCKIGKRCFIGFGAVIFKANLGNEVIVKHLAIVEGVRIPSKKLVPNGVVIDSRNKIKNLKNATKELEDFSQKVVKTNLDLVKGYENV
ncbi:MAG: carbonate dehydratase [Elusimicrobia bacterium RIFOXYD2_FULL_34_15]|nr:MAG: carbonate dehydratase [Elusimicrobia bacterium RIFOXYD2_FULL_34_15]